MRFSHLSHSPRDVMNYDIDLKYLKKSISDFLFEHSGLFRGILLDVGCGDMPYREKILATCPSVEKYLGLDLADNHFSRKSEPDLTWDGTVLPLPTSSVDCAFATEVLEHCPDPAIMTAEIFRVLKPGGAFLFTVPYLWPLHEVPFDFYRYTPFALEKILAENGYQEIAIRMLGGWDASLAQMIGLWVIRRPGLSPITRKLLRTIALPLVKQLISRDKKPREFVESQMITGLTGVARKPDICHGDMYG